MDILRLLQTIGICVGAVALVAIALMLFFVFSTFLPGPPPELDEESLTAMTLDRTSRRKKQRNKKADTAPSPEAGGDESTKPS